MTTAPGNYDIKQADQKWLKTQVESLTFGEALWGHRKCQELTQEQAAKKLGITKQMMSQYETGKRIPSPRNAYRIAEVMGMSPETAVLLTINDQLRADNIDLTVTAQRHEKVAAKYQKQAPRTKKSKSA